MSTQEDWRYSKISGVARATFRFTKYRAPSQKWDHDHCEGCWAKFAEFDGPGVLHEGYVTASPFQEMPEPEFITNCKEQGMRCLRQPTVDGCELFWVCSQCFEDFREILGFQLEP